MIIRPSHARSTVIACALLLSGMARGQSDTVAGKPDWRLDHSPGRAALYSAILPGAGQVYNRKYWKVPIAWAGLGISYYFIRTNNTEYQRYKEAYLAVVDDDPSTVDEFGGAYSSSSLLDVTDTYRRWRDLSYIALGAVYILNVMDAAVDGYFVRFDVDKDLSMGIGPSLPLAAQGVIGVGFSATF